MSPKFRGNTEDWLDDEESGDSRTTGVRPKKKIEARAVGLPAEEANAIVAEVFPNQCRVKLDSDSTNVLCSYRRAGVVSKSKTDSRERTPVAVGDRVRVSQTGSGTGVIEGICLRRNRISRPAPGREGSKFYHVLAANIDLLVVVASTQNPHFSTGLIDRFLVGAEVEDIAVLVCITKIDLANSDERPWNVYRDLGYPVIEVNSKAGTGFPELRKHIENQTVVFCGQSGVGKTSLLSALLGADIGKVGDVNPSTGKGRHTTTGAVLLGGPGASKWIDTPGVKEFGLKQILPKDLGRCFKEFQNISCPQEGCLHLDEPECQARKLIRYPSYRRILESLLAGEG